MMEYTSKDCIVEIVKNKDIIFIFEDFNLELGGVGTSVISRANYLADNGYNVTLLNLDLLINFDYICDEFIKSNVLSKNVKFINVYDYYFKKNSISKNPKYSLDAVLVDEDCFLEKIYNDDKSIILNYYLDDNLQSLVKSELYIDDVLRYKKFFENNKTEYYSYEGFKYLETIPGKQVFLYPREDDKIYFKDLNSFLYYFMDEMCAGSNKPFLVCDSTSHYYNMNGVTSDVYKIGVMHGNPYVLDNKPIDHISPRINHLSHLDDLEALVVLTNEVKADLINELKQDKFVVIPNFISDEVLKTDIASKDNKIRIFSRISPEKQISDAIKAFRIVSDIKPEAVLEIYGRALSNSEKSELKKLKNLIEELNLENNVFLKGYLPDVNIEMQKSLCTLLISKHEGLPLSLLESMANATPVIAYDFKYGVHDVISDKHDGVIIEKGNIDQLANEMMKLLENPQLAIDLGINAREKIKNNFSTSSTGYKWENLFKNVLFNSMFEDINNLKMDNKKLKGKINNLEKLNNSLINSTSWRITKPVRNFKIKLAKILK